MSGFYTEILAGGKVRLHDCVFWMYEKTGMICNGTWFWPKLLFVGLVFALGPCYQSPIYSLNGITWADIDQL